MCKPEGGQPIVQVLFNRNCFEQDSFGVPPPFRRIAISGEIAHVLQKLWNIQHFLYQEVVIALVCQSRDRPKRWISEAERFPTASRRIRSSAL